jgi:hypothetical protein
VKLFLCLLGIGLMFWAAFVSVRLWGWFIVPLGVPPINVWWAVGIGLVGAVLANEGASRPTVLATIRGEDDDEEDVQVIFIKAIAVLFALGIGWVAHIVAF